MLSVQRPSNWTSVGGLENASDAYLGMVETVARVIRASASDLIAGRTCAVAKIIVSTLAHEFGMQPSSRGTQHAEDIQRSVLNARLWEVRRAAVCEHDGNGTKRRSRTTKRSSKEGRKP